MTRLRLGASSVPLPARRLGTAVSERAASECAPSDNPSVAGSADQSGFLEAPPVMDSVAMQREALEREFAERTQALEQAVEAEKQRWAEEAKRQRARLAEEVNLLAEEVAGLRERLEREAIGWAAELGFQALLRVVGQAHADGKLVRAIAESLAEEQGMPSLTLRLHPDLIADAPVLPGITLVPDPNLTKGQQIIETPRGDIDGGVAVRLRSLCEAFIQGLHP
jgi:flagellar biosynthesis/type III secretory pathway protein FliH